MNAVVALIRLPSADDRIHLSHFDLEKLVFIDYFQAVDLQEEEKVSGDLAIRLTWLSNESVAERIDIWHPR